MSFTKKSVTPANSFYNTVTYDIEDESSIPSTLTIISVLTGQLQTDGKTYHIKPISFLFTVRGFEILLGSDKIGSIEYSGWTWKKPKLILKTEGHDQVWIFERNKPALFKRRTNPYLTKLTHQDRAVEFEIELNTARDRTHSLKKLVGTASFNGADRLPCLLGDLFE